MAKKKSLVERASDAIDHALHPHGEHSEDHDYAPADPARHGDVPLEDERVVVKKAEVTDELRPELGKFADDSQDEKALAKHPKFGKHKSTLEEKEND